MSLNLYQTDTFSIEYYEPAHILKSTFSQCCDSDQYRSAIRAFREAYEKILPRFTLWDNTGFRHVISPEEQKWTNTFLNHPCMETGATEKLGFIVSPDVLAMHSVVHVFEEEATFRPGFFINEQQALDWFTGKEELPALQLPVTTPALALNAALDTIFINFKIERQDIPYYLKRLNQILKDELFIRQHHRLFSRLSLQEKKILSFLIQGLSNGQIAGQLQLSVETIKTHRRNILRKLDCQNIAELISYGLFY